MATLVDQGAHPAHPPVLSVPSPHHTTRLALLIGHRIVQGALLTGPGHHAAAQVLEVSIQAVLLTTYKVTMSAVTTVHTWVCDDIVLCIMTTRFTLA